MSSSAPSRPSPRLRRLALTAIGLSVVAAVLGSVFLPVLLRQSPALLLVVQSSYAQMGLASPRLDPVTFVAVAAGRRWLGEVIAFFGGRVLGADALRWYQRRGHPDLRLPTGLDGRTTMLRDAMVVLLPHPLLAALFGVAGMPAGRYVVLKLLGSVLTVLLFRTAFRAVGAPLSTAADFVTANVALLTAVGVGTAAVLLWRRRRAGGDADR